MPNDRRRRLPTQRRGLNGPRFSRNAHDNANGDRAQRRHSESRGSFHFLLLQPGNRSAPAPVEQDACSRGRVASRLGACCGRPRLSGRGAPGTNRAARPIHAWRTVRTACRLESRSEEHTSELQSRLHLVCRLLLEKKKTRQLNDSTMKSLTSFTM